MFPRMDWALLWNTLFDKLLLAGLVVGVGWLANLRLEVHKSRESIRAKMAEQRMPKIAAHVTQFTALEAAVHFEIYSRWSAAFSDADMAVDVLPEDKTEFHYATFRRLWNEHADARGERIKQCEQGRTDLNRDRFWVGAALSDLLSRKYDELYSVQVTGHAAFRYARNMGLRSYSEVKDMVRREASLSLVGRARRRLQAWHDRRVLRQYGLPDDFERTDVDVMVRHVSGR